jgi:outer membrane protein assembly factor BamE (lipoprotein component of BamABCDE complex)
MKIRHAFSLIVIAAGFVGCIALGNEKVLDQETLDKIQVGSTTKGEVETLLGPPSERRSTPLGPHTYEWWAYSYSHSFVNPLDYLLLIGLFINGIGTPDTRKDVQVFFNPDGTVRSLKEQTVSYELRAIRPSKLVSDTRTAALLAPYRHEYVIRYRDKHEFLVR